ncbi:MAG: hypothetical protein K9J13_03275 [Saprospiraceae bacterium]|nr:hypothetical protein [Saprospiraceae bacterium]
MKPTKVLIFVLAVLGVLAIVMVAMPADGVKLNKNFTLQFPTFKELFSSDNAKTVDISKILENQIDIDTVKNLTLIIDSITHDTIKANADKLTKSIVRMAFKDGDKSVLYSFFNKLKNSTGSELIRIMHYGDSQIEGDRITSFLRSKLQNNHGGCGPGLMPAVQPYDFTFAINQTSSDNWKRYTIYGKKDTSLKHSKYGVLAAMSRFAPIQNDSVINDSVIYESTVNFKKSNISFSNTKKFKSFKMFYGNNKKSVFIELYKGEVLLKSDSLKPTNGLGIFSYTLSDYAEEITVKLKGKDSPDIYAIALDDTKGVAVDNIGLRGCSGTIFTKMDRANLKQMYSKLNVQLLILQFGGNVMPYIKDKAACEQYGRYFYSQLAALKTMIPGISIVVIGPSDMSIKEKDKFVTYEHLEDVRDALKDATLKAGGAYWDMYKAMGGKNSMPSWVNADPPLAAPDYTHFSPKGAKVVANMFYNALIIEYKEYLNKK